MRPGAQEHMHTSHANVLANELGQRPWCTAALHCGTACRGEDAHLSHGTSHPKIAMHRTRVPLTPPHAFQIHLGRRPSGCGESLSPTFRIFRFRRPVGVGLRHQTSSALYPHLQSLLNSPHLQASGVSGRGGGPWCSTQSHGQHRSSLFLALTFSRGSNRYEACTCVARFPELHIHAPRTRHLIQRLVSCNPCMP